MTSFACRIEPGPAPRLAAAAILVHVAVSAGPWLLGVPAVTAAILSSAALAGLASTLASVPGRRHRLAALVIDERGVRAREPGAACWVTASLGPRSRVLPGLALVDIRAGNRRHAWLLVRTGLPPDDFRRLRARIRFSC